MTWLDPGAGIVAVAIGLPLLVVLYLLKLRRRPVRVSTIMFWPRAVEDVQANVPLKALRPSWLLLLHVLILCALAAALARPIIIGGALPAQRVILLLDASASMGAVDVAGGATRLERAKARGADLVGRLSGGGSRHAVCVVAFAGEARAVTGFTASRSVIEDALDSVAQTDQPGDLGAAMKLADAVAAGGEGSGETSEPPTIILLSDGSFGGSGRLPPSSTRLVFERIGPGFGSAGGDDLAAAEVPDNIGIAGFSARRDASDPGVVRVFAELINTRPVGVAAPVSLSVDGEVVQRRVVDVAAATPAGVGRESAIFELRRPEGGVVIAAIGRDDALMADNSAALVLPAAERPAILLVTPDEGAVSGDGTRAGIGAAWILEDVLMELRARSLERIGAAEYGRRAEGGLLGGVDLVVFDRVSPAVLPRVGTLSFGAVPRLPGLVAGESAEGTGVVFWQRSHPVLRNVALDAVLVARSTPMRWDEERDARAAVVNEDVRVRYADLMRGRGGALLVLAEEGGGGVRRLVCGFDLADSNWPLQAGFPIFLADSVDFLTLRGDASAGRSFRTGEAVEVRVRPGVEGRVAIKRSGGDELVLRDARQGAGAGALSAGLLTRAGVYLVEGASAMDAAVAVNLVDDVESELASPATVEVAGQAVEGIAGAVGPLEVWWWFVLAAAGLLAVEWGVYAWSVRA